MFRPQDERTVIVSSDKLEGDLVIPVGAQAIILFAHGSGSSRNSTRNQFVAKLLNESGFATLSVDLLTQTEKEVDTQTHQYRFDIQLLTRRFVEVTSWIATASVTKDLKIGYFGSSTGAAAALNAAARLQSTIKAIVSRGGRTDLVDSRTIAQDVTAATLLIVGGNDTPTISLNRKTLRALERAREKKLVIILGAGHLFEEPGTLEEATKYSESWFEKYI